MLIKFIRSDRYRYTGRTDWRTFIKHYVFNRGFRFSVWLRIAATSHISSELAYPYMEN